MARARTYSEVLNLRIDEPLAHEIKRIADKRGASESDTARLLMTWGIEAHRAMEARELQRPYDAPKPKDYYRMVIDVHWEEVEPGEPRWEALPGR